MCQKCIVSVNLVSITSERSKLEDEYNNNLLLRMTSENFEEIFQLIKDDITKENTKMTELIPPRL